MKQGSSWKSIWYRVMSWPLISVMLCQCLEPELISDCINVLTQVTLMRGEEITSCKSHIAPVSLTDWCIMIFIFKKNSKIIEKYTSKLFTTICEHSMLINNNSMLHVSKKSEIWLLFADATVLVGDLVDSTVEDLSGAAEPLQYLSAPYGTFYVTGMLPSSKRTVNYIIILQFYISNILWSHKTKRQIMFTLQTTNSGINVCYGSSPLIVNTSWVLLNGWTFKNVTVFTRVQSIHLREGVKVCMHAKKCWFPYRVHAVDSVFAGPGFWKFQAILQMLDNLLCLIWDFPI